MTNDRLFSLKHKEELKYFGFCNHICKIVGKIFYQRAYDDVRALTLQPTCQKSSIHWFRRSHCAVFAMHPEEELTSAAATGNTERVKHLLQNGVNVNGVNSFQRTPLQVMMMGSTPVARLLLEYGANPNLRDSTTGTTPLHDAARTGYLETVRLLVEFKADAEATDNNNSRPVDLAQSNGHREVVNFLLSL